MFSGIELFEFSRPNSVRFLFLLLSEQSGLKKERKLGKPDALLARILDAAARVKEDENQLR
jgi:hypothetical protein